MRIVSLLPSATEIICALGLDPFLVGVTHECDFPPVVQRLPKVTHTLIPLDAASAAIDHLVRDRLQASQALYLLDVDALEALQPDLIVTQTLCEVCAVAEDEVRDVVCRLDSRPRVLNLEPKTLGDVFDALRQVATAAGVDRRGDEVVANLQCRVETVTRRAAGLRCRPRVTVLEWLDPPFSCGHWNPELVRLAGGVEGLGREGTPSRRLSWNEVIRSQPEVVVIACCGFGVARTMEDVPRLDEVAGWSELPAVRTGRVYVTDGSQYLSRPGPRLVDSLEIVAHALDPDIHPLPDGLAAAVAAGHAKDSRVET